jgi:hypothetical protein
MNALVASDPLRIDDRDPRIEFLRGARIDGRRHSDKTLLDHLLGTRRFLAEWGARPSVCDAGLFHSVYGTESFKVASISFSQRDAVRAVIGDEAEELAWIFSVMRKQTLPLNLAPGARLEVQSRLDDAWLPLTTAQIADLVNLMIANSVEQFPRLRRSIAMSAYAFLSRFRSLALPAAASALDAAAIARPAARWWQVWR